MRTVAAIIILLFTIIPARGQRVTDTNDTLKQEKRVNTGIYKIKPAIDIPVTVAGAALTGYGFYKIGQKSDTDTSVVNALDVNDLIPLNRRATREYDPDASKISDIPFFMMATPILLVFDKHMRSDAGTVGLMFLETMAICGTSYAMTAGHVDKFRPYVYNRNVPIEKRVKSGGRNSFYGGHPSATAAGMFFGAKVFGDYHPDSKLKYPFYALATAATLTNTYLRYKAGQHFPTDLMIGLAIGPAIGFLVPELHKSRLAERTSFYPTFTPNGSGIGVIYSFR